MTNGAKENLINVKGIMNMSKKNRAISNAMIEDIRPKLTLSTYFKNAKSRGKSIISQIDTIGGQIEVEVKTVLTPQEIIEFVDAWFNTACIEEAYFDSLFEYSFRLNILNSMTNLPFSDEDLNEYLVFGEGNLYDAISGIPQVRDVFYVLRNACERRHNQEVQLRSSSNKSALENALAKFMDSMSSAEYKMTSEDADKIFKAVTKINSVSERDVAYAVAQNMKDHIQDVSDKKDE